MAGSPVLPPPSSSTTDDGDDDDDDDDDRVEPSGAEPRGLMHHRRRWELEQLLGPALTLAA